MRGARAAVAALLTAAVVLPAAGCGKDKPKIPRSDSDALVALLREVERQDAKRACKTVSRTIATLQSRVETLPARTDSDIRSTLRDGVTNLRNLVATDCATVKPKPKKPTTTTETQTEPTTTTTEPPTTTTTTTPSTNTGTTTTQPPPPSTQTQPNTSGGSGPGAKKKAGKKSRNGK